MSGPRSANGRAELASVSGLVAAAGELEDGEGLIDRIFATVRASLGCAGVDRAQVDSVVLAADDIADGRSITTMIHATAAGAYLKDEVRVTNGAVTALGLAALRVFAGASARSIVAAWWAPTAGAGRVARAAVERGNAARPFAGDDGPLAGDRAARAACAACVVGPPADGDLLVEGFCWAQAGFDEWVARDGEPAALLHRLGTELRTRCGGLHDSGHLSVSRVAEPGVWGHARVGAGLGADWRDAPAADGNYGVADGLVLLERLAPAIGAGEHAVVLSTGQPAFEQAEAIAVMRRA